MVSELLEREAPLRALEDALSAARCGRGAVVLVSGEPGIGKSALVSRFMAEQTASTRVWLGVCDDLATPRPLGPFHDLIPELSGPLVAALRGTGRSGDFPALLVEDLRTGAVPTVLVVEDVHWADQATMDALTVVGRRLPELPAVLVLTLRPGELEPADPLRAALDAMQRSTVLHVELAPLSRAAVERLAGQDADRIFEVTGGNPFFVTELLAHGADPPPPSLANAVLGRVARLDGSARQLLELISVVPGRVPMRILDLAEPGWGPAADRAEQRQLLTSDPVHVRFRHELTRAAIRSSLPHRRRRQLHRRILDVLLEIGADPADIVHHAEAAGATDVVAEHALAAARQATEAGAIREAFAQWQRAARLMSDRLSPADRAGLYEELSRCAWLAGQVGTAVEAASAGMAAAEAAGDLAAHGRCASLRSKLHWFRGDGEAAWRDACAGVSSFETADRARDLARAYAQSCQLSMLASRADETWRFARRALQLTEQPEIRTRVLAAVGTMRVQVDIDDVDPLLTALSEAVTAGDHEQAVFVLVGLAYVNLLWARPEVAATHAEQARRYAASREFDGMIAFVSALEAWLEARRGSAGIGAARDRRRTSAPSAESGTIASLLASTVAAELAVRRGDGDAGDRLDALAEAVDRTGEVCRIGPVLELQVERALTAGAPPPVERVERVAHIVGPESLSAGCGAARVAAWAAVCGLPPRFSGKAPAPYAAMIAGDWRAAADDFGAIGWQHDRALLLSMLDSEEALTDALRLARSLRAHPLEQRICRRLRERDLPVPRGPQSSTQGNPAHLTDRQLEVLQHLKRGHSNARIAQLLHISPRTVEHHVAGILAKLGASSRVEAIARCVELDVG
jgi:DNA-binding CsgD family transcriptional regulator